MKEIHRRVEMAEQYRTGVLDQNGRAKRMLIAQHAFPYAYSPVDVILTMIAPESIMANNTEILGCLLDHTYHGPSVLKTWIRAAGEQEIFRFLIDLFDADPDTDWTGYRVMVSSKNGFRRWIFELFSKHPYSDTVVYTGVLAPNVVPKL